MKAIVTIGLAYGDEGKGTTVDWLARTHGASLVVRYNGGAQAAHNVVSGDRHHTFAQLGSASFVGVPTLLSRHVLVNPIALAAERRASGFSAPFVEDGALVTTPLHVAANRIRETIRSGGRHGSCGMGIGETTADSLAAPAEALRIRDLFDVAAARRKLLSLRDRLIGTFDAPPDCVDRNVLFDPATIDHCLAGFARFVQTTPIVGPEFLEQALRGPGNVIFEGAQGVLLDQDFGFQPHTTWTDITFGNANDLLCGFAGEVERIGITRAYFTRHGAGPFVSEDPRFDALSAHDHNRTGAWQGRFRSGALDLVALRYALDVIGGVDSLVMTNVDRLPLLNGPVDVVTRYETDEPFFEAGEIRVKRPFDLAYQEALTGALGRVSPVVERFAIESYAERAAEALSLPLRMLSFGAKASDKVGKSSSKIPARSRRAERSGKPAPGTSSI